MSQHIIHTCTCSTTTAKGLKIFPFLTFNEPGTRFVVKKKKKVAKIDTKLVLLKRKEMDDAIGEEEKPTAKRKTNKIVHKLFVLSSYSIPHPNMMMSKKHKKVQKTKAKRSRKKNSLHRSLQHRISTSHE